MQPNKLRKEVQQVIVIALRHQDRLYYKSLSPGETVTFGSGKKDTVQVQGMTEKQISLKEQNGAVAVQTRAPFPVITKTVPIGSVEHIDRSTATTILESRGTGKAAQTYPLPLNGIIRCGRAPANDICIALPFVSGSHLQFRLDDGNIRAEDLNSTNGLYVNGRRVSAAQLRSGDTINLLTVCIRLVNRTLEFENVGTALHFAQQKEVSDAIPQPKPAAAAPADKPAGQILHYRLSPRLQNALPQETIVLDRPPQKGQEYHPTGRFANILSMGAMAGATLAMGGASPALAFARTASLAMNVWNMASMAKQDKQRKAEIDEYNRQREETYRTYIDAQRARIAAVAAEQRAIITEENPAPEDCLKMLAETSRRIWERRSCDRDFLDVRIGMGYEELCVPIKNYAENRGLLMEDDELEALCNQIAEEGELVDFIPRRLPLRSTPTVGVFGSRDQVVHTIRNLIVALTALHSPNDVRLVGIFDNKERARWASLRWLPHIWDTSSQFRYLAFDRESAHRLCDLLCDELGQRAAEASDSYDAKKNPPPLPHYVIILGSRALVEGEPLLDLLAEEHLPLGATTFFLFDEMYQMPRDCGTFLDLTQQFPFLYDRYHANKRVAFSRDSSVDSAVFSTFARKMAALELDEQQTRSNALPSSITFMEGFKAKKIADLQILKRWNEHMVCDSLRTQIGVLPDGSDYELDIHYKAHGAHGLIAGTTGSGKSELLRTWILSMAVNYHPHEVNFVIIDYKGGGMANKLEALPHIVGKITNIDTNITRSLVSLKREAKRRMMILEKYPGVDDVDQYMQLYYSGKASEPMPHLIIVSDEFAELKKEEPEFMKELSSLARVGRSVGIHLVLATQRPAGVVDDQIDSNSRFRICMKVNSVQDSKEMIKRPDAAGITQRGRAYVRIGEDEEFVLLQSYWSGAVYSEQTEAQFPDLVRIVQVSGERLPRKDADTVTSGTAGAPGDDQLTAIVSAIASLAKQNGIKRLNGPWMPQLPEVITTDSLGVPARFSGKEWTGSSEGIFRIPIGLYDRPALQEQGVQYLDFTQTPHYAVYGAPLSGKTTFLKTLILMLGLHYTPDEVSMTILDFGGGSLSQFEQMPHVTAVIREGDNEQVERFKERISNEMQTRKACFRKEKAANFAQYIRKKHKLPAIFIIIDNQLRMNTLVDDMDPFLINVSMSGPDCGIHLIFTSNNHNKTSMNLQTNIGGNIALHMADRNDYRGVVSELPEGCGLPANPGRGLIRDTAAAEFQTAVYMPTDNDEKNTAKLEALIGAMRKCWCGDAPAAIKSMPDSVTFELMTQYYGIPDLIPVGLDYANFQPVYLNLHEKHAMLISAAEQSDGTKTLLALGNLLLTNRSNRLYVLDGRGTLGELSGKAAMYGQDEAQLARIVQTIVKEAQRREDAIFAQQESTEGTAAQRTQLCILIDGIRQISRTLPDECREMLIQIIQSTEQLGILTAAHGTTEELSADLYTENLTIALIDTPATSDYDQQNWQKGICIGDKLRNHDWFVQNKLGDLDPRSPVAQGDGIVFDCGKAVRVRVIR